MKTKIICFRSKESLIIQYADCHYNNQMKPTGKPLKVFPLSKWKDAQNYTMKRAAKEGLMFWLKWDFNKVQRESII